MNQVCVLLGNSIPLDKLTIEESGIPYNKDDTDKVIRDTKSAFYVLKETQNEWILQSLSQNDLGVRFKFTFDKSETELINRTFVHFSSFLEHSIVVNRSYGPTKDKIKSDLYGMREINEKEQEEVDFQHYLEAENNTLISYYGDIALVHKPPVYMENGYQVVTTLETPIASRDYEFGPEREYLLDNEEVNSLVAHDLNLTKRKTLKLVPKDMFISYNQ